MKDTFVGYHDVPYYPQTNEFLRQEGSLTSAQIETWDNSLCGLMCTYMIADQFDDKKHTLADLLNIANERDAYNERRGWIHKKLASLLEDFSIYGVSQRISNIDSLHSLLDDDNLVMASVSPNYLHPEKKDYIHECSGHLVLIVGMRGEPTEGYKLFIHDPSSKVADGGPNLPVDGSLFMQSFSGNIIAFKQINKGNNN